MEDLTYTKAQEELNQILEEIESEDVNIDELSIKIKRACELLKFCDAKLKSTDEEVKKVLDEFQKSTKLEGEGNDVEEDSPFK